VGVGLTREILMRLLVGELELGTLLNLTDFPFRLRDGLPATC
jgi:hypothetical protein